MPRNATASRKRFISLVYPRMDCRRHGPPYENINLYTPKRQDACRVAIGRNGITHPCPARPGGRRAAESIACPGHCRMSENTVQRLFCFGLGYSAGILARRLAARGWRVAGTSRETAKLAELRDAGIEVYP